MALPPQIDQTFIREVDEELRRDQVVQAWKRWGRWIIGGIVLALVLLAGFLFYQNQQAASAGNQGIAYDTAVQDLKQGQLDKTAPALAKIANSSSGGYRAMARVWQATVLAQKNQAQQAAAAFGGIADDSSVPQPIRDFALVRRTQIEFDQLKPQLVIDRLKGMASPESPWFGTAGEMVAAAYVKLGRRDVAAKLFAQIAQNDSVPDSLRQRAVQMASVLGADAPGQAGDKKLP